MENWKHQSSCSRFQTPQNAISTSLSLVCEDAFASKDMIDGDDRGMREKQIYVNW